MLLQRILDHVDTYVPNSLSYTIKIEFINEIQKQLYRDYPLTDAIHPFTTTTSQLYVLPTDCAEDRIDGVAIDDNEEFYISSPFRHKYDVDAFYWTVQAGVLFINPVRDAGLQGYVYYKPRPFELSEDNLAESPTFPQDYHELLVYGCAKKVALASVPPDYKLYAVYDANFQAIAEKANRDFGKKRNKQVLNVRSWR